MYTRIGIAVLAILVPGNQPARPQASNSFNGFALVDQSGNIRNPADFRDLYQTPGTYVVLDPKGGDQMHLTYASPGAADYYRRNRKFADGTVLGKEVFGTEHAPTTTGDGWDGRYSNPMRLTSRPRLTIKRTASAAISRQRPMTGFT